MFDVVTRFLDHFTSQRKGTAYAIALSLLAGTAASVALKSVGKARRARA